MSKAKPFLIGTALGASAMFFSLQYHIVRSQDGFRVLPRTPQQSLGLTYADIRGWNAGQWTDRPELARALMAHGSSDLISESVTHTLADTVTEDSSTLDELRTFLNRASDAAAPAADAAAEGKSGDSSIEGKAGEDTFRIPFPQDAKLVGPADPFRVAGTQGGTDSAVPVSRFSADEVREGLQNVPARASAGGATQPAAVPASGRSHRSTSEQARAMEDQLFGSQPQTPARVTGKSDESEAMFEDVTSQLESRAQDALNRARSTVTGKAASTVESARPAAESFIRSKVADAIPGATDATTKGAESTGLMDFDPFLE